MAGFPLRLTHIRSEWRLLLPALIAGLVVILAFAPFGLWPLAILSPALLFTLWEGRSPMQAARLGFAFGLGQFGIGVSWVYVAIHTYGFTPAPIAALLTLLFCALLALFPATVGWLYRRFALPERFAVFAPFVLASYWVLLEWIRVWFLTGFPWLNLGYSQSDSALIGYAPLFGVLAIAWLVALSAASLAVLRTGRWLPLLLVVLLWAAGEWLRTIEWSQPEGEPIRVSLIQGNVPQVTKWDPETYSLRLQRYAEMTVAEVGRAELVIWPENSMTLFQHELQSDYLDPLEAHLAAKGGALIAGLPILDENGDDYYTGLLVVGSGERYTKRHLVPFGEFVPLAGLLRGLVNFFDLPMSSFSSGPDEQPPLAVAGQRLAASVCYEDLFGDDIRRGVHNATLLLNGSNNAWYGDSLAPHQHLQISRMRAVENARPMLRATTNGISALINAHGAIMARSQQFESEVLRGEVRGYVGTTPYTRWGDWPLLLLIASIIGITLLMHRLQNNEQQP